jgi:DNA-binding transcriptional ArsR family regulator
MADNLAFATLADPSRNICERSAVAPQPVGGPDRGLLVGRPAVCQHLKVLKAAGLVTDRPEGARRLYQIDPLGLGQLRAWLDRLWDGALEAFEAEVEREEDGEGKTS